MEDKTEEVVPLNVYSLFADTDARFTHTLNYMDNEWVFEYRQLTWGEKTDIIDQSYIIHKGENVSRFNIGRYWIQCLAKMVTDSPIHQEPTLAWNAITLSLLDQNVVEQLVDICPKVDTTAEVKEVKKDSPELTD